MLKLGAIGVFPRLGSYVVVALIAAVAFLYVAGPVEAEGAAPANDAAENAEIINGDSASVSGNNEFATREKGESDHIRSGSSVGRNSVWFRWTAWESGPMKADVCRSGFDNVIAVYTKDSRGEFDQIADNDDGCLSPNLRGGSVVFEAELEKTYWIAVSGYSKVSSGNFVLRLRPYLPPE